MAQKGSDGCLPSSAYVGRICVVGERGGVSKALQSALRAAGYPFVVASTDSILRSGALPEAITKAELVVLCTQDFASPQVFARLPTHLKVLDISPAFRTDSKWVYGLPELPGARERIAGARLVANPGCFATAAILLLEPLVRFALLSASTPIYLDGVGGFTTGGAVFVEKAAAGTLAVESVFGLTKEHRHIAEIRHVTGLSGPVIFTPKVALAERGIRMQIPFFGLEVSSVLIAYRAAFEGTGIQVDANSPGRVAVTDWADTPGACVRVYPQSGGVLAVCALDNMGKGAVDAAMENVTLMLG